VSNQRASKQGFKTEVRRCYNWEELLSECKQLIKGSAQLEYVFRGDSRCRPITSSLDRDFDRFAVKEETRLLVERSLIREFRRKYRESDRELVISDTIYCLAQMRHFGAPARVIDASYSPSVAGFFALETWNIPDGGDELPVWLKDKHMNEDGLSKKNAETLAQYPVIWCFGFKSRPASSDRPPLRDSREERMFGQSDTPFVKTVTPFELNERITVQQGTLLIQGTLNNTFADNMRASIEAGKATGVLIRLLLDRREFEWALESLYRVNLTTASIYPGLEGFTKSLSFRIPFFVKHPAVKSHWFKKPPAWSSLE
jgi:hypothetical protein